MYPNGVYNRGTGLDRHIEVTRAWYEKQYRQTVKDRRSGREVVFVGVCKTIVVVVRVGLSVSRVNVNSHPLSQVQEGLG